MGQVVPFIARVRDSGDWTAAERARLEALAERLAAGGVHVEVVFGATDEGDPWCVVTGEDGEVLIHVARIGGRFVVHSAVDDALTEGADLHAVLRDRLAATDEAAAATAVVLPFGLAARQGQTFLALVIATAFFHETAGLSDPAEAGEILPALPDLADLPPPPTDHDLPEQERTLALQGAALQQVAPAPAAAVLVAAAATRATETYAAQAAAPAAPNLAADPPPPAARSEGVLAAPVQAAPVITGGPGDDLLVGTAADERLVGGDGNDTLRGGGGHDSLEGGAGDDRIELTPDAVATGGAGADTFVVQAPAEMGHPDTLLGVILDFSGQDGDRIVTGGGRPIEVPAQPPTPDPPTPEGPPSQPPTGFFGPTTLSPLTRVEVDLDDDGTYDGYVLVRPAQGAPVETDEAKPIEVTGQSLGALEPVW